MEGEINLRGMQQMFLSFALVMGELAEKTDHDYRFLHKMKELNEISEKLSQYLHYLAAKTEELTAEEPEPPHDSGLKCANIELIIKRLENIDNTLKDIKAILAWANSTMPDQLEVLSPKKEA